MNSQEAIILMMAQKLKNCDEREMRQLCSRTPGSGPDSADAVFQTIERWAKLDKATQHKILNLLKNKSVRDELSNLKAHINQLMETPKKPHMGG